jgi:hypothetical protein
LGSIRTHVDIRLNQRRVRAFLISIRLFQRLLIYDLDMNFIKKTWMTFRHLKTWIQIVIVLVLLSLFGAISGSGSTSTDSVSTPAASSEPSSSAQPEVTSTPTDSAKPAVSSAEFKTALSKMRVVKDAVKNLKFYYDKSSPRYVNANGFYLYAGQEAGSDPYLFLGIQYFGSDWLFIQSYFFNVDGETYEITPNYGDINTDNDTDVWEWYNEPATDANIEMVQKIVDSKKTILRLEGRQYHKDVTITQAQKAAFKNVLSVYQGLGGTL